MRRGGGGWLHPPPSSESISLAAGRSGTARPVVRPGCRGCRSGCRPRRSGHWPASRPWADVTTTVSPSMVASAQANLPSSPAMAKPSSLPPPLATRPPPRWSKVSRIALSFTVLRLVDRAGKLDILAVGRGQGAEGQAPTDVLLVLGVDVERLADVDRQADPDVGQGLGRQDTGLREARPRPTRPAPSSPAGSWRAGRCRTGSRRPRTRPASP